MKTKRYFWPVILAITTLLIITIAFFVNRNNEEEVEFIYSNRLTKEQTIELAQFYKLESDVDLETIEAGDSFTLYPTDETETIARLWTYYVHDQRRELAREHIQYYLEYVEFVNFYAKSINNSYADDVPYTWTLFLIRNMVNSSFVIEYPYEAYYLYFYLPDFYYERITWRDDIGMNLLQYIDNGMFYQLGSEQVSEPSSYTGEELMPDQLTEETIDILNELLWSDSEVFIDCFSQFKTENEDYKSLDNGEPALVASRAVAEELGFSEENPFTVEWVCNYPVQANELIHKLSEDFRYTFLWATSTSTTDYIHRERQMQFMDDIDYKEFSWGKGTEDSLSTEQLKVECIR